VPEPCEAHRAKVSSEVSSRLEGADRLRRFGPSYAQTHAVSPFEQRIMDDLTACRHRHGPNCQSVTKMRWIEARRAELLRHLTFTPSSPCHMS